MSDSKNILDDFSFNKTIQTEPKITFSKTVYNVSAKSKDLIKDILFIEIRHLLRWRNQYSFGGLSAPVNNNDGSATYTITLTLNEVNVKS